MLSIKGAFSPEPLHCILSFCLPCACQSYFLLRQFSATACHLHVIMSVVSRQSDSFKCRLNYHTIPSASNEKQTQRKQCERVSVAHNTNSEQCVQNKPINVLSICHVLPFNLPCAVRNTNLREAIFPIIYSCSFNTPVLTHSYSPTKVLLISP